jgi:hypothetical protein
VNGPGKFIQRQIPPYVRKICIMAESKSKKGTKPPKKVENPVKKSLKAVKREQEKTEKAALVLAGETVSVMAVARDLALELIDDPDELAEGEEEVES